ncbi:MAG: hypothetical protein PHV62_05835 [Sulfuricurvum sp.]|nr:hypothetical protein [Sulfuricurvum sp.]
MDEDQNGLAEQQSGDSEDVENGGVGPGDAEEQGASGAEQGSANKDDSDVIKRRLVQQAKKHHREMRQMQEQMMQMHQAIGGDNARPQYPNDPQNAYSSPGQPNGPGMSEEEKIQKAVRFALGVKDHEEKQAKMAQGQAHVQKQYARLNDEFDRASDKYEDFDDVVRGEDTPFTTHVRDALLLVENPSDVAYRLAKNRSELERISQLHPLDQAREVNKLSFSLMSGNNGKSSSSPKSNPLGSVKVNPANSSSAVTDKTPPSVIRARMKAGTWK